MCQSPPHCKERKREKSRRRRRRRREKKKEIRYGSLITCTKELKLPGTGRVPWVNPLPTVKSKRCILDTYPKCIGPYRPDTHNRRSRGNLSRQVQPFAAAAAALLRDLIHRPAPLVTVTSSTAHPSSPVTSYWYWDISTGTSLGLPLGALEKVRVPRKWSLGRASWAPRARAAPPRLLPPPSPLLDLSRGRSCRDGLRGR